MTELYIVYSSTHSSTLNIVESSYDILSKISYKLIMGAIDSYESLDDFPRFPRLSDAGIACSTCTKWRSVARLVMKCFLLKIFTIII